MQISLRILLCLAVAAAIATDPAPRSRTAASGPVTAVIADEELAPGDLAEIELTVRAGLAVAIEQVAVDGLGTLAVHTATWGSSLESDGTTGEDRYRLRVPIGPELQDRRTLLGIDVRYVVAEGYLTFANHRYTDRVEVELFVRSPDASRLRTALAWARPIAVWLASIALTAWAIAALRRRERTNELAWIAIGSALVGYLWFAPHALELLRASGLVARFAAAAWWLLGFVIAAVLSAPSRLAKFRVERDGTAPVAAHDLAAALAAAGLIVRERRARLEITRFGRERAVVRLPPSRTLGAGPLELEATTRDLVLAMLPGLAPVLGTLRYHAPDLGNLVFDAPLPTL